MRLKFWGVRGSIPTPGAQTSRYGGNTPCVELRPEPDILFILDAGTGIFRFGDELVRNGSPVRARIFLTHTHWDHIQGFPFFEPMLSERNEFTIIGCDHPDVSLRDILSDQMRAIYFPLQFSELKSKIEFKIVSEESFNIDGVDVSSMFMNHPGYTLGYRLTYKGRSIVYISDNEPFDPCKKDSTMNKVERPIVDLFTNQMNGNPNSRVIEFIKGADVLIHDTSYTPGEYSRRELWGHSDYMFTLDLAIRGNVKKLFLFHHGPDHTDDLIDSIVRTCRAEVERRHIGLQCEAAAEDMVLEL